MWYICLGIHESNGFVWVDALVCVLYFEYVQDVDCYDVRYFCIETLLACLVIPADFRLFYAIRLGRNLLRFLSVRPAALRLVIDLS